MEDKRLITRLTAYWNDQRKGSMIPPWTRLNAKALDDIWEQCCVLRMEGDDSTAHEYVYEYVGKGVKEVLGSDPTGVMVTKHFRHFPGARIVQKMDDVVQKLAPLNDSALFINEQARIVKCRSCLLPFGTKQGRVTHVILAISSKEFE